MHVLTRQFKADYPARAMFAGIVLVFLVLIAIGFPLDADALPAFATQTGMQCATCHAGGQFPELTPFGRMFKLTGFTIGESALRMSVMGLTSVATVANTSKSDDPSSDFRKNGALLPLATGSAFVAGKVSDHLGGFAQMTYDNYAVAGADGSYAGHTQADNIDLRYANHFNNGKTDLIYGASLNNNPSISDPWNTAAAWMQYVPVPSPTSHQFIDGSTPYPGFGSGGNIAGLSAYTLWNQTVYAELGTYRTADKALSFMSAGVADADKTKLSGGNNPYWRLAVTHEWGPHNLMVGTSGMIAHVYDAGTDTGNAANLGSFRNSGLDAQYQYLLDPHTVTVQLAYMRQAQSYSATKVAGGASAFFLADGVTSIAAVNPSDTTNTFRAKMSYIYRARYGGSLAFFNRTGTTNTLNQTSGYDSSGTITSADSTRVTGNLLGNPATRGLTYEAFWMPWQNVRVGAQYTVYSLFNGASDNYDGFGRNASDNNTVFLYAWYAF